MDTSETTDDLTNGIEENENSIPMTLESIPIKSLAPNGQEVNELNQRIILNYKWNGNNIPCSFNYVGDMENLIALDQNLNQLPDFQSSQEPILTDEQDQGCYKVINEADLPSNETSNSRELLQNDVEISVNESTIVKDLQCNNIFKDEENKILVSEMGDEIFEVFTQDELPTEPTVVFAQSKNGGIIQLIGSYSALISEGNNDVPQIIHGTTMPNLINDSVEDTATTSQEQIEDSEMLYYSQDGQILFCSTEDIKANTNEIVPPTEINSANGDGVVTVINSTEPDCEMVELIESVEADNQFLNQNHLIIYSTDSHSDEVYNSSVTPQNANIITVVDEDNFSDNSTKLALLDEEGNIVGLLCDRESEPEKIISTIDDKSFDTTSCDISTILNVCPDPIVKHKPEIRCRIVSPTIKANKARKKTYKPSSKCREPKSKSKALELLSPLPAKASWSVDVPTENNTSPKILVLHPLRTRRTTLRHPQGLPLPVSCKSGSESTLGNFDKDSISIPMINENRKSNGKIKNCRKQKFKILKDAPDILFCINKIINRKPTTTNKVYLDRYADSEIPEINDIFARKKRVVSICGNRGSTSSGEVSSSRAVVDSSQPLFSNSCAKEKSVAKQPDSLLESASSDDEPPEHVGKSLKCDKCGKIFKSSRSVSIHKRLCKQHLESNSSSTLDKVASEVCKKEVKEVEAKSSEDVKTPCVDNSSGSSLMLKRKRITRSHTKLLENKKRK